MGSLADDLLAPPMIRNRGATCGVYLLLEELAVSDPAGADALRVVLANSQYPATVIARRLEVAGHNRLGPAAIQRHRRQECRCP